MSAAFSPALDKTARRVFPRHLIQVPLDLIVLRFGVPENLPGRCIDISEAGVGAVVAGEVPAGQQVAVEFRLPNLGVPVRTRALVRYQSQLRCGLEFVGLTVEQREMIRYWVHRSTFGTDGWNKPATGGIAETSNAELPDPVADRPSRPRRRFRIARRTLFLLLTLILVLSGFAWWQWQRSWNELERQSLPSESKMRVPSETINKRIVSKIEPEYPLAAQAVGAEGMVVLDAVIAPDGTVKSLRPLSGTDMLVRAASDAVRSWKFEPFLAAGQAVEVETTIAVEFRLH